MIFFKIKNNSTENYIKYIKMDFIRENNKSLRFTLVFTALQKKNIEHKINGYKI